MDREQIIKAQDMEINKTEDRQKVQMVKVQETVVPIIRIQVNQTIEIQISLLLELRVKTQGMEMMLTQGCPEDKIIKAQVNQMSRIQEERIKMDKEPILKDKDLEIN